MSVINYIDTMQNTISKIGIEKDFPYCDLRKGDIAEFHLIEHLEFLEYGMIAAVEVKNSFLGIGRIKPYRDDEENYFYLRTDNEVTLVKKCEVTSFLRLRYVVRMPKRMDGSFVL